MLKIYEVGSYEEKKKVFSKYNVNKDIWLVANMNDKREWQNLIFQSHNLIIDDNLQRVGEFWRYLYNFIADKYTYISADFFRLWIKENVAVVKDFDEAFLIGFINQLQDYLFDFTQYEFLEEWIKENASGTADFKQTLVVLQEVCTKIADSKVVSDVFLVKIIEQNLEHILSLWQFEGEIYIDLNFDILPIEAKVLNQISKTKKLNLLIPKIGDKIFNTYDYQRYLPFTEDSRYIKDSTIFQAMQSLHKGEKLKDLISSDANYSYHVFTSTYHEVLNVMGQVRDLLAKGTSKDDIKILAADKAKYELVLQYFLKKEGINSSFIVDEPCSSYKGAQDLLSYLRVLNKRFTYSDFVQPLDEGTPDFQQIESLLVEGLENERILTKKEYSKFYNSLKSNLTKWDLLKALETNLKNFNARAVDATFSILLNDVPDEITLPLNSWLIYLERITRKTFLKKQNFIEGDLRITNLSEGLEYSHSHIFILGLNDADLRFNVPSLLENVDLQKISSDLGFWFENQFSTKKYYHVLHLLNETSKKIYLSYSSKDNFGQALAPSLIHHYLNAQEAIASSYTLNLANATKSEELDDSVVVSNYKPKKLSASKLESYIKCPFIYFAQNLFLLEGPRPIGTTPSNLDRGSIFHHVVDALVRNKNFSAGRDEIKNLVLYFFKKLEIQILNPVFKETYILEQTRQVERFLDFERNWRQAHKDIETIECEFSLRGYLNTNASFSTENGEISFSGRIDRIDADINGNLILIDYKSGSSSKNSSQWLKEGSLQLAIYSLFLEDTKIFDKYKNIIGCIYFSFKSLDRETGFLELGIDNSISLSKSAKAFYISAEEKRMLLEDTRSLLIEVLANINQGVFSPKPHLDKHCDRCDWRDLCRAKHLY